MRPGGACTACPGFSLSSSTTAHSRPARAITTGNAAGVFHTRRPGTEPRRDAGQGTAPGQPPTIPQAQPDSPARVQSLHSRHRGRTEPRNRARVQGYRQAPKRPTEPPTAAHRGKQSTAPGIAPPETPVNAPQSHAGRGCYPYTTRRQNSPQRRTEPPTEGKPPGVQKRRGGQAYSRHSPGTAPRAKIRAIFYDFSSDFLPFFPALSRSASEFYSRKSIVGKSKVARRWKSERV